MGGGLSRIKARIAAAALSTNSSVSALPICETRKRSPESVPGAWQKGHRAFRRFNFLESF